MNQIEQKADFVIIDTPPISVSADAITISEVADTTILVVRTDCVPVEDINEVILNVTEAGGNIEGCVLNNVYKPFTLFGQLGTDERGYHGQSNYYAYSKTGRSVSDEVVKDNGGFSKNSLDNLNRNE